MDARQLDRRVTLLRATSAPNGFNEPVETWHELANVAAKKSPVSDGEAMKSAEIAATISDRFVIRWSDRVRDLNPADRALCEGRTYNIVGVKELERRKWLEFSAFARSDL